MSKPVFILAAVLCLAGSLHAQTRRIAYKSHSGSAANYKKLMLNRPFYLNASNFGEGMMLQERLDSVIYVDAHTSILVTSKLDYVMVNNKTSEKWVSRRDTIRNSPLLSKRHSMDSIRAIYSLNGHFSNSMDEVKFIGYDNKKPLPQKTR